MNDIAPIDLLVLDDHAIVRQGVMLLLLQQPWIARCRGASSIDEALQLIEESPVDAAVVDLSLKRASGFDAIDALRRRWPQLPVVVLTMHADSIHCQRAFQRGALGFVAKDDASEELAEALRRALAHERYLSSSVRPLRIGEPAVPRPTLPSSLDEALAQLTRRERQVLALMGRGSSAAEMAVELGRSIKTVESHRNSLREKLGLKNNRQLLQLAARWGEVGEHD